MPKGTQHTLLQKLKNIYHLQVAWWAAFRHGYPGRKLIVIGVTGTDGKTTTSTMLYHILRAADKQVALITTIKAIYDEQELSTGLHVTSQDPKDLQPLLKKMLQQGVQYVVLETTSHALDQHRVYGIDFTVAVVTNITEDHLDYHGTVQHYQQAKSKLFSSLKNNSITQENKAAVINADDNSFELLSQLSPSRQYHYNQPIKGENYHAVFATKITPSISGVAFDLNIGDSTTHIELPILGTYNVHNAQAAAAAAHALGIGMDEIRRGLEQLPQIDGRMELISNDRGYTVIVDFAHTPFSLEHALGELKPLAQGRLIVLFGCAGQRDKKRRRMGEVAARLADIIIITNEDNRDEPIESIMAEIGNYAKKAGAREGNLTTAQLDQLPVFFTIADRTEALRFALSIARRGDIIDATGKGHEQSLNVDGDEREWDERTVIRKLIEQI